METVTLNGKEVDFAAAEMLMNEGIREWLNEKLAPCTEQEFLDAYVEAHRKELDEEFKVD